MIKRKRHNLRGGDVIYVEEYHDGCYGSPGKKRVKRAKPTKEQMILINAQQKAKRCRLKLLEYFDTGDLYVNWTYEVRNRPEDMKGALMHFQKAIRRVRKEYAKRGRELFWIRNIEQGTKGAWHIHVVLNEIGNTVDIVRKAWEHGGTYIETIKMSERLYDADFTKLASYMTKDENTREPKEDGTLGRPKIREASYNTSRNMPIPEPEVDKLRYWKKNPWIQKGYCLLASHEGTNPLGFKYRRYTMIRIRREQSGRIATGRYLC